MLAGSCFFSILKCFELFLNLLGPFGFFWNVLESFGMLRNLYETFFWNLLDLLESFEIFEQLGRPRTQE